MNNIKNAMSIDVEDYFQVSAFEKYIDRNDWDNIPTRVEANVQNILNVLDEKNTAATFFMLGWVAERFPQMVKEIVQRGHEIASHGYSHVRVTEQTPEEFKQDITKTKKMLEDLSGEQVLGYRAASYSINKTNLWAHDEIENAGYKYSSSIYPIKHDLYGIPDAPRFPYKVGQNELLEIPISTVELLGRRFPCGGGGYFRFYPYPFSRYMINRINKLEQEPCVFYFHPWEIDFEQPKQQGLDAKTRVRHYLNLKRMQHRLDKLLTDLSWGRMDKVFL